MDDLNYKNNFANDEKDTTLEVPEYILQTPTIETVPETQPLPVGSAVSSMVIGILSIILGVDFGIPGIILAIIGKSKSKKLLAQYPATRVAGFAKAGKITSTIGLITSIFFLFFWIFYIGILVFAALSGALN